MGLCNDVKVDGSRPLLSRSGCIYRQEEYAETKTVSSRPLLSRSGCIWQNYGSLYLEGKVLVPFYRGAVVFIDKKSMLKLKQ